MNSPTPRSRNRTFLVEGLDCADEINALLHEVEPLVGDRDKLDFNVFSQTMTIETLPSDVSSAQIMEAISRAGLKGREITLREVEQTEGAPFWTKQERLILTSISGFAILLALIAQRVTGSGFGGRGRAAGLQLCEVSLLGLYRRGALVSCS